MYLVHKIISIHYLKPHNTYSCIIIDIILYHTIYKYYIVLFCCTRVPRLLKVTVDRGWATARERTILLFGLHNVKNNRIQCNAYCSLGRSPTRS